MGTDNVYADLGYDDEMLINAQFVSKTADIIDRKSQKPNPDLSRGFAGNSSSQTFQPARGRSGIFDIASGTFTSRCRRAAKAAIG
jgi:hypothetical protein